MLFLFIIAKLFFITLYLYFYFYSTLSNSFYTLSNIFNLLSLLSSYNGKFPTTFFLLKYTSNIAIILFRGLIINSLSIILFLSSSTFIPVFLTFFYISIKYTSPLSFINTEHLTPSAFSVTV